MSYPQGNLSRTAYEPWHMGVSKCRLTRMLQPTLEPVQDFTMTAGPTIYTIRELVRIRSALLACPISRIERDHTN